MDDKFVFGISIIFYYILVILGGLFNALIGTLGNTIIGDTSIALFYIIFYFSHILIICSYFIIFNIKK